MKNGLTRALLPAVLGLGLVTSLPQKTAAQGPPPLPEPECSICAPMPPTWVRICLPFWSGAEGCNYAGGRCNVTGSACNTPEPQSLAVAPEDRLVVPTDAGNVMVLRLERNIFGGWGCDVELNTSYRDDGNGVVVELSPSELALYTGRYSFEAYSQDRDTSHEVSELR